MAILGPSRMPFFRALDTASHTVLAAHTLKIGIRYLWEFALPVIKLTLVVDQNFCVSHFYLLLVEKRFQKIRK